MGLREEKKEKQRQDILDTAIALFRKKGFDGTRVQDVTSKLRISEATFFNYFPSKEAVLQAFGASNQDGFDMVLEHLIDERDRTVPDRLRELMQLLAYNFSEDRAFMATVITRSNFFFAPPEDPMHERYGRHRDLLAQLMAEGQKRNELRRDVDPGHLGELLTGMYILIIADWLVEGGATWQWSRSREELEPRLLRTLDVFVAGAQPKSSGRHRGHPIRK